MKFELKEVVPWGRNLNEYTKMFSLGEDDLNNKIIGFGDGPASFNFEMTSLGKQVQSIDIIYQFSEDELLKRILETKDEIIRLAKQNMDNFLWTHIESVEKLEQIRMKAMETFLSDFEQGKKEGRYLYHSLPDPTPFKALEFDLALSSHFLMLYPQLGLDFHIRTISEMLRVSREVRIFPLVDLNAKPTSVLSGVLEHFNSKYDVHIQQVDYEFQKTGNKMLVIKNIVMD